MVINPNVIWRSDNHVDRCCIKNYIHDRYTICQIKRNFVYFLIWLDPSLQGFVAEIISTGFLASIIVPVVTFLAFAIITCVTSTSSRLASLIVVNALYIVSIKIVSITSLPPFFNLSILNRIICSIFPQVPPMIIASTCGSVGKISCALDRITSAFKPNFKRFFLVSSVAFSSKSIAYTLLSFVCKQSSTVILPLPQPISIAEEFSFSRNLLRTRALTSSFVIGTCSVLSNSSSGIPGVL